MSLVFLNLGDLKDGKTQLRKASLVIEAFKNKTKPKIIS